MMWHQYVAVTIILSESQLFSDEHFWSLCIFVYYTNHNLSIHLSAKICLLCLEVIDPIDKKSKIQFGSIITQLISMHYSSPFY